MSQGCQVTALRCAGSRGRSAPGASTRHRADRPLRLASAAEDPAFDASHTEAGQSRCPPYAAFMDRADNADTWCMRFFHSGAVAFAWPVEPVLSRADVVAVGLAAGTSGLVPVGYPNDPGIMDEQALEGQFRHVERTWQTTNCLYVHQQNQWWGTRLMWDASSGAFLCWYVDFLQPMSCHGEFLDTRDLALDIVVLPNGKTRWKDEDRYAHKIEVGLISDEERAHVDLARADVVAAIESRRFPFDGSFFDWKPDGRHRTLPGSALEIR